MKIIGMPKRIKILFTIPNFDTAGSGKVVYDLVRGLDRTVFEPEICCFHDHGAFFQTIKTLGVKIHLFPFAAPYRPFLSFPLRVFKKQKFDLIHSWHWSSDISEPLAAKLAGIPFVYTKKAMGWGNKSWRWRSKLSTKIITINEDMVQQFFSKMLHKVEQIPLGIDTNYFVPLEKSDKIPETITIEKDDFVVLTVANLAPVKGVEILIEAVKLLNDDKIMVLIVGDHDNAYGHELMEQYRSDRVHFSGKKQDVRPYLAIADVFVIPTKDEGRKEGLPIAPLEAMSSQRIVLGSDVSGIRDILKENKDLLFKANDIDELKDKLKIIMQLSNKEKLILEKKMRSYVVEYFHMDQFISKHNNLYWNVSK
jgi:glycosyltransferase involved in cell wall biosynthesis